MENNLTPITMTVFIGLKQSGKSFRASKIENSIDINFADTLKKIAGFVLTEDHSIFTNNSKIYASFKNSTIGSTTIKGRSFLQRLGSAIREIDKDFFVKAWLSNVKTVLEKEKYKNITCSDARFENEIDAIFNEFAGRVSFVFCDYKSPNYDLSDRHESELLAHKLIEMGFKDGDSLSYNQIKQAFLTIK